MLGALILTSPLRLRYRMAGAGVAAVIAVAGAAPDLDLLIGRHSAETHSVGAGVIAGLAAWAWLRMRKATRAAPLAAAVALAVLSHVLFDWLGSDTSAPIGVMALWPLSSGYYESGLHIFMAVSRRYWLEAFWTYNLMVLGRELLLLGIPAAIVERRLRRQR